MVVGELYGGRAWLELAVDKRIIGGKSVYKELVVKVALSLLLFNASSVPFLALEVQAGPEVVHAESPCMGTWPPRIMGGQQTLWWSPLVLKWGLGYGSGLWSWDCRVAGWRVRLRVEASSEPHYPEPPGLPTHPRPSLDTPDKLQFPCSAEPFLPSWDQAFIHLLDHEGKGCLWIQCLKQCLENNWHMADITDWSLV